MADTTNNQVKGSRRTNAVFIGVLVVLVVAAFAVWRFVGATSESVYAIIHDGDGGTTVLELTKDETRTISTSFGTNVVEVRGGAVQVTEADCPNHDCIQQGAISQVGQQVVCLPHQLWVEVSASRDGAGAAMNTQVSDDVYDTVSS